MRILALFTLIFLVACTQVVPAPVEPANPTEPRETAEVVEEVEQTVQAAPLEVQTLDGESFSLADNVEAGKPTVVYFMASWCPTCAKNWEALNVVVPRYADEVEFIAVSIDPTDDVTTLQELATEKGFTFATSPGNPDLALDYDVTKQTAKFAINREGNIVQRHDGALSEEEWDAFFQSTI
jgi:cytochrome oxidase Cu insertion factor (SCO1/SenC/PrrC family)